MHASNEGKPFQMINAQKLTQKSLSALNSSTHSPTIKLKKFAQVTTKQVYHLQTKFDLKQAARSAQLCGGASEESKKVVKIVTDDYKNESNDETVLAHGLYSNPDFAGDL